MDKYKNKYRIPSARLSGWDYANNGAYFITICTQNGEHYFGEIINGEMQLSNIGVLANVIWHQIKNRIKHVELGSFVVMPNHMHGILILNKTNHVETLHATSKPPTPKQHNETETLHATSLPPPARKTQKNEFMASISPKPNSISTIIRSYKSEVSKHANRLGFKFQWQSRFHDHIIRNESSFQKISTYINNNPANWQQDKFYT